MGGFKLIKTETYSFKPLKRSIIVLSFILTLQKNIKRHIHKLELETKINKKFLFVKCINIVWSVILTKKYFLYFINIILWLKNNHFTLKIPCLILIVKFVLENMRIKFNKINTFEHHKSVKIINIGCLNCIKYTFNPKLKYLPMTIVLNVNKYLTNWTLKIFSMRRLKILGWFASYIYSRK